MQIKLIIFIAYVVQVLAVHPHFSLAAIPSRLTENSNRFVYGVKRTFDEQLSSLQLRKSRGKNGPKTFSEYNQLQRSSENLWTLAKTLIMLPLAPELFFFSYILSPLLFSDPNDPQSFSAFPRTFDTVEARIRKDNVCGKKRFDALIQAVRHMSTNSKDSSDEFLSAFVKGLLAHCPRDALIEMKAFMYETEQNLKQLKLPKVPGDLLGTIVESLGGTPAMNLPILNRFNANELEKILKKVSCYLYYVPLPLTSLLLTIKLTNVNRLLTAMSLLLQNFMV